MTILVLHLIGDFLLQNHVMQMKSKSSLICTIHVAAYSIPFCFGVGCGVLNHLQLAAILIEHWLQDRYALHLRWMKFFRQTPPDLWPVGPLCMDQSMHLAFIALVMSIR